MSGPRRRGTGEMPKLKNVEELSRLRAELQDEISLRLDVGTTITVGMGTCGIASGAREVMRAIQDELTKHDVDAEVVAAGCVGMCEHTPLVEIHQVGRPTVTYGNLSPARARRVVQEHLIAERTIEDWVVRR